MVVTCSKGLVVKAETRLRAKFPVIDGGGGTVTSLLLLLLGARRLYSLTKSTMEISCSL